VTNTISIDMIRRYLESGVKIVYAKRLNAKHTVRSCYVLQFDRRKGFHSIEQNTRQLRVTMENDGGILLLVFKDQKILPAFEEYGFELITDIPLESEEEIYQQLPRYDFTIQVQVQRIIRKLQ